MEEELQIKKKEEVEEKEDDDDDNRSSKMISKYNRPHQTTKTESGTAGGGRRLNKQGMRSDRGGGEGGG